MMRNYRGDGIAAEDIANISICVMSEDNLIREIQSEDDLFTNNMVFVCNIPRLNDSFDYIREGEMVRYIPLYVLIR